METQVMELKQEALAWPAKAKALIVRDQQSYQQATGDLLGIKDLMNRINEYCDPNIKRWHEGHKAAVADKKATVQPLLDAEAIYKTNISKWVQEQERIRLEAQRKADEEARKREEEARLALAIEAEQNGASKETTEEILNMPIQMVAPTVAPTFNQAEGVSTRKYWKWRLVDESRIPRNFLMVDEKKINAIVRSMGPKAGIPGIEVYRDTGITVRR